MAFVGFLLSHGITSWVCVCVDRAAHAKNNAYILSIYLLHMHAIQQQSHLIPTNNDSTYVLCIRIRIIFPLPFPFQAKNTQKLHTHLHRLTR